jgi:hypothetical protein
MASLLTLDFPLFGPPAQHRLVREIARCMGGGDARRRAPGDAFGPNKGSDCSVKIMGRHGFPLPARDAGNYVQPEEALKSVLIRRGSYLLAPSYRPARGGKTRSAFKSGWAVAISLIELSEIKGGGQFA